MYVPMGFNKWQQRDVPVNPVVIVNSSFTIIPRKPLNDDNNNNNNQQNKTNEQNK